MNAKGTHGPSVPFLESEEEQPARAKALRRGQHRKIRVRTEVIRQQGTLGLWDAVVDRESHGTIVSIESLA